MADWLDRLIGRITPADKKPIVVTDTAQLLRFKECEIRLKALDYQIHHVASGLALRFAFEIHGRHHDRVMFVLETESQIPADICVEAVSVAVSLGDVFPNFDAKTLLGLSYNALCTLDSLRIFDALGQEGTTKFLLENLYQVDLGALNTFRTKERVLSILISVVLHPDRPNAAITRYLEGLAVRMLGPIGATLSSPSVLKQFLQVECEKRVGGSSALNFEDPVFEKALNQLFIAGDLKQVVVTREQFGELGLSSKIGYRLDDANEKVRRLDTLLAHLEDRALNIENQPQPWFELAPALGEVCLLTADNSQAGLRSRFEEVIARLNNRFQIYVQHYYGSSHTLQGARYPFAVHKIMDYMRAQSPTKRAFLMIDGMSVAQWRLLSESLAEAGHQVQELASFAWLPSITAWSRQAFFRGARPLLTEDNSKESALFREYWVKFGLLDYQIEYSKFGVGQAPTVPSLDAMAVAYVCNDLDELMHGSQMGLDQLYQGTRLWLEKSGVVGLVGSLRKLDYAVCITADHGNLCTTGLQNLRLPDRQASKSRSKRHLECVTVEDAQRFRENNSSLRLGILGNNVYLTGDGAFTADKTVITHGGSHLLEMLIPVGVIQ